MKNGSFPIVGSRLLPILTLICLSFASCHFIGGCLGRQAIKRGLQSMIIPTVTFLAIEEVFSANSIVDKFNLKTEVSQPINVSIYNEHNRQINIDYSLDGEKWEQGKIAAKQKKDIPSTAKGLVGVKISSKNKNTGPADGQYFLISQSKCFKVELIDGRYHLTEIPNQ